MLSPALKKRFTFRIPSFLFSRFYTLLLTVPPFKLLFGTYGEASYTPDVLVSFSVFGSIGRYCEGAVLRSDVWCGIVLWSFRLQLLNQYS